MPARPTPADAPVTTATSDARRTKSLLLFHSGVGAVEKIRHCYAYQNPGEEPRHAWGEKQTETQSCGAPWRHAIGTRNQVADSALNATAPRLLFHFPRSGAANVIDKRRAKNAGDSVLGDDTAQLMRGYSQQREIKQAEFFRQAVLLGGNTCQHSHTRQVKPQQHCILREQLFLALFFVCSFSAVLFDRKIDCGFIRLCSLHTS